MIDENTVINLVTEDAEEQEDVGHSINCDGMSEEDLKRQLNEFHTENHQLQYALQQMESKLKAISQEHAIAVQNELTIYREILPYLLIERDTLRSKVAGG